MRGVEKDGSGQVSGDMWSVSQQSATVSVAVTAECLCCAWEAGEVVSAVFYPSFAVTTMTMMTARQHQQGWKSSWQRSLEVLRGAPAEGVEAR